MDELFAGFEPYLALALPWVYKLALALARTAGIIMALPQMIGKRVPRIVKGAVAVSFASSLVWIDASVPTTLMIRPDMLTLVTAMLFEALLGLTIGFFIHITLAAVRMAGEVSGVEMGLSFGAVVDPMSSSTSTPISALFGHLAVQMFVAMGFDRELVRALGRSVLAQPLGTAAFPTSYAMDIVGTTKAMFTAGVSMALPVLGAVFALKLSMALLTRVAPKLQIFTLAFVLSILVGLLVLRASIPSIGVAVASHYEKSAQQLHRLVSRTNR